MPRRYRRLQGSSAYYPFAARTSLRAGQRRKARLLRLAGLAALGLAAALFLRHTVLHGGQPTPPLVPAMPVLADATPETAATAEPLPHRVTVQPVAATLDALAGAGSADDQQEMPIISPTPTAPPAAMLPQYRALYEENPDLVGWLSIPALEIELPVLSSPGRNEYYLRRGFDKLFAPGGSLFLDERCRLGRDPDQTPTASWLIYGHNMADGSMLGGLPRYRDEEFYHAHPTFRFDTLYESQTWQIVAAFDTVLGADELPYYTFFDADGPRDWQDRVDAMLALALYDTDVVPEYGDQLLILSTCGNTSSRTDKRFALLAMPAD